MERKKTKKGKKLINLRMFANWTPGNYDEERLMKVEEIMEHLEEEEQPYLYLAACAVRGLFLIANELDTIRRRI